MTPEHPSDPPLTSGLSFAEIREAASTVRTPTLMAWAEDDPIVEPAIGLELSSVLPAGERLAFPTGGHNVQKSRAIELGDAISAFAGQSFRPRSAACAL